MKLFAPVYYKNFKCIADKCKHSCCIGWEIDIDSNTRNKYTFLTDGYGDIINTSIDTDGTPHFRLSENDKCPHLNGKGLCNIILELGEDYLCDICREHPRFYNNTPRGKEVGIGMACEEACRLILENDNYYDIVEISETTGTNAEYNEFDTISQRNNLYSVLSDTSSSHKNKLESIYNLYGVSPSRLRDDEWRKVICSLEYLDEAHKGLFSNYSSALSTKKELEKPLERALAYFIYRHCTEAIDENDFRAALGFCLFCERLLASIAISKGAYNTAEIVQIARIISEELEYSEDNTEAIKFEFCF